jgi:hypothetical protein
MRSRNWAWGLECRLALFEKLEIYRPPLSTLGEYPPKDGVGKATQKLLLAFRLECSDDLAIISL